MSSVREYLKRIGAVPLMEGKHASLYRADLILWAVIDMQNRSVNVINIDMLPEFEQMLDVCDKIVKTNTPNKDRSDNSSPHQPPVRAIVITSGKSGSFIVGADIDAMYPNVDQSISLEGSKVLHRVLSRISLFPIPTIAAINGTALGGGLEVCLACKHRVAPDNRKVQIGLPEVKLGLIPGAGGSVRLPKLIGLSRALPMILAGGSINPAKAKSIGLIDEIIPSEDRLQNEHRFYAGVQEFAIRCINDPHKFAHSTHQSVQERLLDNTSVGRYVTARMAARNLDTQTKGLFPAPYLALDSAYNASATQSVNQSDLDLEANYFSQLSVTPQSKALMSLFYMMEQAKKRPKFLPFDEITDIKRVGILGAGVMGSQIATLLAMRGYSVYLRDISQPSLVKAGEMINQSIKSRVQKNKLTEQAAERIEQSIKRGVELGPLSDCQLIIEAAVERMDLKQQILAECETFMSEKAIFATNTSALSITELASVSKRPQRVIGLHFFNPVNRMPLVEVIAHDSADKAAIATAFDFTSKIGKIPVYVARDAPGFIVNRLLGLYMNEAGHLASQGFDMKHIDVILERWGAPMGPFRLMDEVGLDVVNHVGPVLYRTLGPRFHPAEDYQSLLAQYPTMLGKKTGCGFYVYDDKGKVEHRNPTILHAWHTLIRSKGVSKPSLSEATERALIIDRCVLPMINEAVAILDEGVARNAQDVDLALITGAGFAIPYAGLLGYADSRGLDEIVNRLRVLQAQATDSLSAVRFKPHPKLVDMASKGERFFPQRPDPRKLKPINHLPRSRL